MKLVFATNNPNKLSELQDLVPEGIEILSLKDINCNEELPETNPTLEGNALQKAQYVYQNYGFNCFADDTGLEVAALNGAPGVHSARFAGPERSDEANMNKLLIALKDSSDRSAQFKTVITYCDATTSEQFTGVVRGLIATEKSGTEGFGYDPIFIPEDQHKTFAQMPLAEKNKYSHRARAMTKFLIFLEERAV